MVIPTRGNSSILARTVSALCAQSHPPELTDVVVVVDGPGLEATRRRAADATEGRNPPRVRVTASGGRGPGAARNAGAAAADGCDLLLFTDDDAVPSPDWVAEMAAAHAQEPGTALTGPVTALAPRNPFSAAYGAIEEAVRRGHHSSGRGYFPAANLGLPVGRFRELDGFDSSYVVSEDRDLCDRWAARQWPVRFLPAAAVAHAHPKSLGELWGTYFRYGRGAYRFHRDRQRSRRGREAARTSGATMASVLALARSPRRLAAVATWQAATAAGFTAAALSIGLVQPLIRLLRRWRGPPPPAPPSRGSCS